MATLNRVDPDSTAYLLREILAELRSMNSYRMSRPQPEGDEPVPVQDPNQKQLPLDAVAANVPAQTSKPSPEPGDKTDDEVPQKPGPATAPGRGAEQGPAA